MVSLTSSSIIVPFLIVALATKHIPASYPLYTLFFYLKNYLEERMFFCFLLKRHLIRECFLDHLI